MKKIAYSFLLALVTLAVVSALKPLPFASPKAPPRMSGAGKAMDAWVLSRAYPGTTLPVEKWASATAEWQAAASTQKTTASTWESMGPHNIGGRTLRLAFNPQNPSTLYAGSAAGGLWRSYTAGVGPTAWHRITTGFPVLGVAAIAVHPQDTNIMLVGTGEVYNDGRTGGRVNMRLTRGTYGIGMLRTTDGGTTWSKPIDWAYGDLRGIQDIAFSPNSPNVALAATTEGLYRSSDAGASWLQVSTVRMANDLLWHHSSPDTVMAAIGNLASAGANVYRSTDAGLTWAAAGNGLPAFTGKTTLSGTASSPWHVFASVADSLTGYGIFKTTNLGASWTPIVFTDYQLYQGWFSHDLAVSPWNRDRIAFVGIEAWLTTNGGTSITRASDWSAWSINTTPPIGGPEGPANYVHADIHHVLFHPSDSNQIYYATDGGIFRSYDGGTAFEGLNGMYQTQQFYADFSNSHQDSTFALGGLQDNATAVYQGDKAWYRVIGGDGCCTAINPTVDDIVYASTQYATIWQSFDRAFSFNYLSSQPVGNNYAFVTSYQLCPDNPVTIYACTDFVSVSGDGGNFWTTTNGGSPLNGNNVLRVAVAPGSSCETVYASVAPGNFGRSAVFRTTNGGGSWQDITNNLPDRFYHEFAIHPTNPDIVYVALGGFGTAHLYKSTNGGASWSALAAGLPDVPGNTVTIDPLNADHVYFGNDVGVYVSTDAGANWAPMASGLPEAVLAIDLSISPVDRKLRVATHGSGVYQVDLLAGGVTTIDPGPVGPQGSSISPNPARGHSTLRFNLATASQVEIEVFDVGGRAMGKAASRGTYSKGSHTQQLDLEGWAPGVYFVVLRSGGKRVVHRLAVL